MIVSISGTPGSGKSTVGKEVARRLKLKHYSSGDLTRELAKKHKMSVLEFSKLEEKDENIDKEVDDVQIELGNKEDNFVIDSRLGYYFIPHSIKILLKCDIKEGAKRIFNDKEASRNSSEKENATLKGTEDAIKSRMESEKKRFRQYYDLDFMSEEDYDLIVDTTKLSPSETAEKILNFIKGFDSKRKHDEEEIAKDEEKYFKVMKGSEGKKKGKKDKDKSDEDDFSDDSDEMDDNFDEDSEDEL